MRVYKCIILLIFLSWSILACGQYLRFEQDLIFKNYSHQAGLPSAKIFQIAQSQTGVIWFGTRLGLCRYNGNEFEFWGVRDGLPGNSIYHLYPENERVWVDTRSDFGYWENEVYTTIGLGEQETCNNMIFGEDGHRYCATNKGIYRIKGDSIKKLNIELSPRPAMRIELVEADGTLWINFGHTLLRIQNGNIKQVINLSDRTHFGDRSFLIRDQNSLLFVSNYGIYEIKNGIATEAFPEVRDILLEASLSAAIIDTDGNLWIGTFFDGLYFIEKDDTDARQLKQYFNDFAIGDVFEDRDKNIWISAADQGLFMLSYRSRKIQNLTQDSPGANVAASKMQKTIRTSGGSWSYHNNKISLVTDEGTLEVPFKSTIQDMVVGADNEVFACSMDGLFQLPEQELIDFYNKYSSFSSRAFNEAFRITEISTRGLCYDDVNKRLWFYSQNGLQVFEGGIIESTRLMNTDTAKWYISDILHDPGTDVLWLSSFGKGLVLMTSDTLVNFSKSHGLIGDHNTLLQMDGKGNLWLFGLEGISRLSNINYDSYTFEISGVLSQDDMIDGDLEGGMVSTDSVLVRTNSGYSIFSQDLIDMQSFTKPGVELTDFSAMGESLKQDSTYRFKEDQNELSFGFTGICYNNNDLVSYRFRMLGLNDEWRYTTSRSLEYVNLGPGDYTFEVFARDANGQESEKPASVAFSIEPISNHSRLYSLAILLVGILVGLAIWRRTKQRNHQVPY